MRLLSDVTPLVLCKPAHKSFRNFDLSEYPESKLVVRQQVKFRTFHQIKLAYANISSYDFTRKPCLLFYKKILSVSRLNLCYRIDIMGGFLRIEINFQFIKE
jgi:hypothetical protein